MYGLYGLKHQIVEIRGDVTMRDERTNHDDNKQLKIELLSQWKLEAEFRNKNKPNCLKEQEASSYKTDDQTKVHQDRVGRCRHIELFD